jgi:hypothetical protein
MSSMCIQIHLKQWTVLNTVLLERISNYHVHLESSAVGNFLLVLVSRQMFETFPLVIECLCNCKFLFVGSGGQVPMSESLPFVFVTSFSSAAWCVQVYSSRNEESYPQYKHCRDVSYNKWDQICHWQWHGESQVNSSTLNSSNSRSRNSEVWYHIHKVFWVGKSGAVVMCSVYLNGRQLPTKKHVYIWK